MPKFVEALSNAHANAGPYHHRPTASASASPATKKVVPLVWNPAFDIKYPEEQVAEIFEMVISCLPYALVLNIIAAMKRCNLLVGDFAELSEQVANIKNVVLTSTTGQIIGVLFNTAIGNLHQLVSDDSLLCVDVDAEALGLDVKRHGLAWCGISKHPLMIPTSDGKKEILCNCGIAARYNKATVWGTRVSPSFWNCANGLCRFKIESRAVKRMVDHLAQYNMDRLPIVYCTDHPIGVIHMGYTAANEDNEQEELVLRCTSKTGDKWCTSKVNVLDEQRFTPLNGKLLQLLPKLYRLENLK